MKIFIIVCAIIVGVCALAFLLCFILYRALFTAPRKETNTSRMVINAPQFLERKETLLSLIDEALTFEYEGVSITSEDGYKLFGKFYKGKEGAPVMILFHGYRSNAIRDFSGGLTYSIKSGYNVLLVDERAQGQSGGRCMTFGVKERKDCLKWIEYVLSRFGEQTKIILLGISMGASTVLMATELGLPKNVVGIIADSGYTSAKDIICKVTRDMHCSDKFFYPVISFTAKFFGKFDPKECDTRVALKGCNIPVLIIHGEDDRLVPVEMSRLNYDVCSSDKDIFTVPDAGHCLGFILDEKGYKQKLDGFIKKVTA